MAEPPKIFQVIHGALGLGSVTRCDSALAGEQARFVSGLKSRLENKGMQGDLYQSCEVLAIKCGGPPNQIAHQVTPKQL